MQSIPFALLASRIGGNTLAGEMRKANFAKFAPGFIQTLVNQLGPLVGPGITTLDAVAMHASGKAIFKSDVIELELSEDQLRKDGVMLKYKLRNADGLPLLNGERSIASLAKDTELPLLLHEFRLKLQPQKKLFN